MSVPERVVAVRTIHRVSVARSSPTVLAVGRAAAGVTAVETTQRVVVARAGTRVVGIRGAGARGPQGPVGPAGVAGRSYAVATEPIPANHVVSLDGAGAAYLADFDQMPDAVRVLGVAVDAALAGELVEVITDGLLVAGAPTWAPGPQFLAVGGALSPVPSVSGFHLQVGVAASATVLIVRPQFPIFLEEP